MKTLFILMLIVSSTTIFAGTLGESQEMTGAEICASELSKGAVMPALETTKEVKSTSAILK